MRFSTSPSRSKTSTSSAIDQPLQEALTREGGGWAADRVDKLGAICGSADVLRWGVEANANPPKIKTHDRFGNRIDEVEFHPAWHELMEIGISHGVHSLPWTDPVPGSNVARAALFTQLTQAEAGVGCPISMTFSVIPALRTQPEVAAEWEPRFLSNYYDGELRPGRDQARRARRHGDDREAGRLRRPGQHHAAPCR